MTSTVTRPRTPKPAPRQAIDARKRDAAVKVAAVQKSVKALGRTGAPITRSAVATLAGVSRSFTYQNETANSIITEAQSTSQARARGHVEVLTAQQEASWRERALNAEDRSRALRRELTVQHQLVADLLGQLRDPDGTWLEHDRNRLRDENERLLVGRNELLVERDELLRKLRGARANVSRLNHDRVKELFPQGPGPDRDADGITPTITTMTTSSLAVPD
ncbi:MULTISPECIES: DUF6262 family protein [Rhodococcus]|uniref:DUF6262 family protein n=1 Tax=Rhodococcus TaxID=1827 RepID=UPI002955393B|nr:MULTISPECIES: DUF6262 family protein [Rhodococcus]MDV7246629.1 DUF6262 family protein [Rhodococcus oxybenzonivorans]MDV7337641.1 DUF6262 family protein [Rhodococcus oxybenzonivorans]MDV8031349.1 DUF6262 family protein [Rhodococcus sp. IEGM 27]